jgi:trans-2-enoyl-CoA reductase
MDDKQINKLADEITFNQLYKLIRKTVQNGWVEFTETYTNELGDFANYKDVFLESVEEELDETDEPFIN